MNKPYAVDLGMDGWKPEDDYSWIGGEYWAVTRLIQLSQDLYPVELPLMALNLTDRLDVNIKELATHYLRIQNADLKYPVILDEVGNVMDGRHRIAKALAEGKKTILCVRFEKNPTPCGKADED